MDSVTTSSGVEIELKLRVADGEALRGILSVAGGEAAAPVRQVNHFFDCASRTLRAHSFGLRLRDEEGRFFLTAKGPSDKGGSGALSKRREAEIEVTPTLGAAILDGAESALDVLERDAGTKDAAALCMMLRHAVADEPLAYIGAFVNIRTRVATSLPSRKGPLDVVLELDQTAFPHGHIHFEVEMELSADVDEDVAEAALRDLLHLAGVEGFPSKGKASRFFAALDGHAI